MNDRMKMTPREPTDEMIEAGFDATGSGDADFHFSAIWQAMHDAAPSPWRPMDEAPKDGTEILIFARNIYGVNRHIGHWMQMSDSWADREGYHWPVDNVLAWMPLPEPPEP